MESLRPTNTLTNRLSRQLSPSGIPIRAAGECLAGLRGKVTCLQAVVVWVIHVSGFQEEESCRDPADKHTPFLIMKVTNKRMCLIFITPLLLLSCCLLLCISAALL